MTLRSRQARNLYARFSDHPTGVLCGREIRALGEMTSLRLTGQSVLHQSLGRKNKYYTAIKFDV